MRKIISSIDLGSNELKLIVAEIRSAKTYILAVCTEKSHGIKNGIVKNQEELINSLKKLLKKGEDCLGLPIKKVIITVPSNEAKYEVGSGVNTITNPDSIIRGSDIVRALQASVYNRIPKNRELISVIPIDFIVDNDKLVENPKNMIAKKIEVRSLIVSAPKKNVYDVLNCFDKLNVEVIDIAFGAMGDYEVFKNELTQDKTGALINIGDQTTTVSIFSKGVIVNSDILKLGGENIDNDISFIYKINKRDARRLKEKLSLAHKRLAQASVSEEIENTLEKKVKINQYEISEIVMSRLAEILSLAKKQINHLTKQEISYIIISGGVTESLDFSLLLEEIYGKEVILGKINTLGVRNNKFSSALGNIKVFNKKLILRDKEFSMFDFEELEEFENNHKKINISNDSILGKIFGYFFDD